MNMMHRRGIMWLLFAAGTVCLMGGAVGAASLFVASQHYRRTTATVRNIRTQKVYRHRRVQYDSRMYISYPTTQYGEISAVVASYCPFRREGDTLLLWYHPDRPRDIRRPRAEACLYGLLAVTGLLCVAGATATRPH